MTESSATSTKALTACPLDCPDACSLEVSIEDGRIAHIAASSVNPGTEGYICNKVRDYGEHVHHGSRIAQPLIRESAKDEAPLFRGASWDEALDLVAERMGAAREAHGGDAIVPVCFGGSNGALTQDSTDELLFGRLGASRVLRTVCAVPTGLASAGLYGGMQGISFEDYEQAQLIVVWGSNPHATGIHLVPHVQRAQKAGAKLVVVDPRRTPLAKKADLHLAVRPGADLPLALAVHRILFEEGGADEDFLGAHTTGADVLRERAKPWTVERAAEETGIDAADIRAFAELYAASSPAVIRCGWGLERSRSGGSAVCAVLALPAVGGKFGVRGGGYTMSNGGAWRDLNPACAPEAGWGRELNMNRLGHDLAELDDPPIDVLFVYNSNLAATNPNQELVRRSLRRGSLFTVVHDQVMTETCELADVVLPATTFLEHADLRKAYGGNSLQLVDPVLEPVGEAWPNYRLFAELAKRMGVWRDGDEDRAEELASRVLAGNDRILTDLKTQGVALTDPPAPIQFVDIHPRTSDGKVHLAPADLDAQTPRGLYGYVEDPGTEASPLALISPATARTISSSLGQLHDDLVPLALHPEDAAARGLADGDPIRAFNDYGEVHTSVALDPTLRRGVASLPKGLWAHNTTNGSTANALAPDTLSDLGGGACYNDARIEVEKAG